MFANSAPVTSNQDSLHPGLDIMVRRHLDSSWRQPVADFDVVAFNDASAWRQEQGPDRPLIFDSGCGTGCSTRWLAQQYPDALVFGLDQSADRLARSARRFELPENARLFRTDCAGFWRLAQQAGWRLARHTVLYPNPWPKAAHLKRRWHGHPVWPSMLALGGQLEVRSNWLIYLDEMAQALSISGLPSQVSRLTVTEPVTDFENKYAASGQALWALTADLRTMTA